MSVSDQVLMLFYRLFDDDRDRVRGRWMKDIHNRSMNPVRVVRLGPIGRWFDAFCAMGEMCGFAFVADGSSTTVIGTEFSVQPVPEFYDRLMRCREQGKPEDRIIYQVEEIMDYLVGTAIPSAIQMRVDRIATTAVSHTVAEHFNQFRIWPGEPGFRTDREVSLRNEVAGARLGGVLNPKE